MSCPLNIHPLLLLLESSYTYLERQWAQVEDSLSQSVLHLDVIL